MKNVILIEFKMTDLRPLLNSISVITGKLFQIARPLLLNRMCGFRGDISWKFQLDQIQDGQPVATFDFIMFNNWKLVRPLLLNKRRGFRKGYVLTIFNSIKLKMADMRQLSTSKI